MRQITIFNIVHKSLSERGLGFPSVDINVTGIVSHPYDNPPHNTGVLMMVLQSCLLNKFRLTFLRNVTFLCNGKQREITKRETCVERTSKLIEVYS